MEKAMAKRGIRLWKLYEQEAEEARAAAAVNLARGPAYESWARFWLECAARYEKWARGAPGSEQVQFAVNERVHRRAYKALSRPD